MMNPIRIRIFFEFPAQDPGCRTSMLWASSTLADAPYLSYVETLVSESQSYTFDYAALLDEALALHGQPITYWAFAAASLPGVEAWSLWANRIAPRAWSNHHHGSDSAEYFPDLHLPGPPDLSLGDVTWLESAQVGDSSSCHWMIGGQPSSSMMEKHGSCPSVALSFNRLFESGSCHVDAAHRIYPQ